MATGGGEKFSETRDFSEEDIQRMVRFLDNKTTYKVIPKVEYGELLNASIKHDMVQNPQHMSTPRSQRNVSSSNDLGLTNVSLPNIPVFSGDEPPQKGDTGFEVWRFEVRCLIRDGVYPQAVILQAIRKSLRGVARRILLTLGEGATASAIVTKLDGVFGTVSTHEALMQRFYTEEQQQNESVAMWGCRLEGILQDAIDQGHISLAAKNDMLRSKFWTGLREERLRNATRHKYDSITDFDELRRTIRMIEQELSGGNKVTSGKGNKTGVQHHPVTAEDTQLSTISRQMSDLMKRLETLEKKVSSKDTAHEPKATHSNQPSVSEQYGQSDRSRGQRFRPRGGRSRNGGYRGGNKPQTSYNRDQSPLNG